jgi:HK97 family phage major capsid protein
MGELNVNEVVQQTLTALKEQEEAERLEKERFEKEVNERVDAKKAEILEEAKKEAKAWLESEGEVAVNKKTKLGSGGAPEEGDMEAFRYWMRTGDEEVARKSFKKISDGQGQGVDEESRKALSQASGAAGEYLVPDGFVAGIIEKRDEISFPRKMGVNIYQTNRKVIDLPAEDTSLTKFVRTAELGLYDSNDPSFAQNQVTVEKWTKITRFSEELLDDDAAGLEDWYQRALARAWANTEAYYVAVGSGTNQHQGIFVGGDTDALTLNTDAGADSDGNISLESLWKLFYTLGGGYRDDPSASWLMDDQTFAGIVALAQSNEPVFAGARMLDLGGEVPKLLGKRVFLQGDIDTQSSGVCFIMFGVPYYYALVERKGLTISRNPYLYQATGEIAFFSSFRQSGRVTQEEAWVGGVGA